ncbi:MAG: hypothetical protein GC189_12505 [Alphaproteobacteria bacterium]|nr:hypothetical protein [Alphaproteobacteria bacterium]
MGNFVDEKPIKRRARKYAEGLHDEAARAAAEPWLMKRLRENPLNAQPISEKALKTAPEWAKRAHASGVAVHSFRTDIGVRVQIASLIGKLNRLHAIYRARAASALDRERRVAYLARETLDKFTRMDDASLNAHFTSIFAAGETCAVEEKRALCVCAQEVVRVSADKTWRRIRSVKELDALGHALQNCLPSPERRLNRYAEALLAGQASFWALEENGAPIAAAMVDAAGCVQQLKGRKNARISPSGAAAITLFKTKAFWVEMVVFGQRMSLAAHRLGLVLDMAETKPRRASRVSAVH